MKPSSSHSIHSFLKESDTAGEPCYETDFYKKQLKIERSHFWFVFRNEVILQAMRFIEKRLREPVDMLEIGCGAGNVLSFLNANGFPVEGADLYLNGLIECRKRTQGNLYQFDVRAIPFQEKWNVIGCFDVIEHMEEDGLALRSIHQALKKNGWLILTVPAVEMLYSKQEGTHKRRYSRKALMTKLREAGFTVERVTYFFFILFPLFFVFRLIRKWKGQAVFQDDDFTLHPVLNRVFLKACMIERKILRFTSLPIGSSLLCIARKIS